VKEERILYPEADRDLAPDLAARLTDLEQFPMPAGWVCIKARG
jgi:hypothetical protein